MIEVPAKITGLVTRHNFQSGRVAYSLEVVMLGKRFNLPVEEEFVARLDSMLEKEEVGAIEPAHEEDPSQEYGFGSIERDPSDYSYEEIEQL